MRTLRSITYNYRMDQCYDMAASIPAWWAGGLLILGCVGCYTLGWVQAKRDSEGK